MNVCFPSVWCKKSDRGFVWRSCHFAEGVPKLHRGKVGQKGMSCLSVLGVGKL